jgi:PAS domain S-box-containing protein
LLANQAARRLLERICPGSRSIIDIAIHGEMRYASSGERVERDSIPVVRALRGETVAAEEYAFGRNDAESLRLRVAGIPVRDERGRVHGAVSVFTDVTAEYQQATRMARLFEAEQHARAETEQALAQLEGSQQRLRLALEASHMGTWDYDVVQDRLEWSREMGAVIGAPIGSLSGTLEHGLSFFHQEDQAAVRKRLDEALELGQSLKFEARVVERGTGRTRWLMIRGRVYRDTQGRPLRMTGIAMDVTERKEGEAALHTLARGERLRALGEMASGIAHDLNQKLTLIAGFSDMARQELAQAAPDTSRLREMVDISARAALEGGQSLKGLLSFVRTQHLMAEAEEFDVGELLHGVARLTAPHWRDAAQAEGRSINVEVNSDPGCAIRGSPGALREAFTNLIFNAVDALPQGGSIFLHARRGDEHAIVEVRDTGTGIPPELQARIFDPFFTTKGERGTGLGLPQVMAIVERHGGTLDVASRPGEGTTFRMTFPAANPPAEATRPTTERGAGSGVARLIRILVVEDEQQLARMAALVLAQRGHHVKTAESYEEAVQHLDQEPVELVISDLGLGAGKNGWDLAATVRERWPQARFVLVTGWGAAIDPRDAAERGVHEVIAKPYRIAELREIADRVAVELSSEGDG